ncbi:MAG: EAL domain-containing protein [Desulfobulbus sp.]
MRKEQVIDMDAHRKSLVFTELVNISELRELCESFTAITGAVTAIIDLEGNILIATGWQDICTRFHRVHMTTASRCRESDTALSGQLNKGAGYSVYKCKNGLVDVAVPITIDGEHTANLFTGQFFFEPPDTNYFIHQAEEFGFDKTDYLAALSRVPIFSENQVRTMMDFLSRLARLIGEMGLVRKSLEVRVEQRTANLRNTNEQLQREIAERKQAEEQLKFTNVLLSTTQETSIDGILVVDENARILSVNRRFVEMWGIPAKLVEEKIDEPVLQFVAVQLVDPDSSIQKIRYLYEHRQETSRDELPLMDGRVFDRYSAPMFGSDNQYYGRVWYFRDITERKQAEEKILHLATHDVLTGLPNRAMFSQLLNHAIRTAQRYQYQFAVFFIDLDRFKIVNDTLGHEAGDQLLQEIAMRLKQALRSADIVARLGGDEFVLLVDKVNDLNQVATVAHKVLSAASKPMVLLGEECRVTASIGISIYPRDAEDEQFLMKTADTAMYLAKEKGKNNYQFYSKEIQSKSIERQSIETNLHSALERNEFFLHYQARLDFKTGAITGVEALLRWQNPYLGSMTPTQFIPVAEETGLMVPIGRWVLKTACAQNVAWQNQGLPPVCMAVNVSFKQLTDDNLVNDIRTALKDSAMAPNLLEIEIPESMLMHNPESVLAQLTKIKDMGVRLAIDNFGTGYTSLSQIKGLPIDMIKVDRSFIYNLLQNTENKTITEAIIAMGKTLCLTVVAEGVETQAQMDFLREHDCDEMCGYLFNRPTTPDQFADLLRNHVSVSQN